jgi:hypothetical protein
MNAKTNTRLIALPILFSAVLLLLAGCDSSANKQGQARLEMSTHAVTQDTDTTLVTGKDTIIFRDGRRVNLDKLETGVESRAGQIHVYNGYYQGAWIAGSPVRHDIEQEGDRIEIRIYLDDPPETIPDMLPFPLLYDAWVTNLEAGSYDVVIRHRNDETRDPEPWNAWVTVLEKQVKVQ